MPAATLPIHAEPPPQFTVEAFYVEQARKALEVFELAMQLPIPGLAGHHKPNLPGFPLEDTISYLRSAVMGYMLTHDDRFTDLFDWEHGKFTMTHDERFALEWADGLIQHLIDRWEWRHLLAAHDSDDTVAAAVIPDDPPIAISLRPRPRSSGTSRSTAKASTREPWFYGFLELWAGLILLAAGLQALAAIFAIIVAVMFAGETTDTATTGSFGAAYVAGIAFAGCLGSITLAALIKMLVDIGRSLRGIYQRDG